MIQPIKAIVNRIFIKFSLESEIILSIIRFF